MEQTDAPNVEETKLETRERILVAGRKLLFEESDAAVTTEQLAKSAGVSKSSIYKFFGDMKGVLSEVARREGERLPWQKVEVSADRDVLYMALYDFGVQLLSLLDNPEIRRFERRVLAVSQADPEMGIRFFDVTYEAATVFVAGYITQAQSHAFIASDLPAHDLADMLVCAWKGSAYTRGLLEISPKPYGDEAHDRVRAGLSLIFS